MDFQPQPANAGHEQVSFAINSPSTERSLGSQSLPRHGGTRCYWALLRSPDLTFAYLDPVLRHHLEDQASSLPGRSLLEFVHPDEQELVRRDVGDMLESQGIHDSVTRVRFCRLSRVRRILSSSDPQSLSPTPSQPINAPYASQAWAAAVSLDDKYMAVDIVINCPTPRVVLCFIHAVVDLDPIADNDISLAVTRGGERKRGWTNWCGTGKLSDAEMQAIWSGLHEIRDKAVAEGNHIQAGENPGTRLFQILENTRNHSLRITWPPDSDLSPSLGGLVGPDFAKLVDSVSEINTGSRPGDDAKTSCTRRPKSQTTLTTPIRSQIAVESEFIPHGTIIFACHRVVSISYPPSTPSIHDPRVAHNQNMIMSYSNSPSSFASTTSSSLSVENTAGGPYTTMPSLSSANSGHYNYSNSFSTHGSSNGSSRWSTESYSHPAVNRSWPERGPYWHSTGSLFDSTYGRSSPSGLAYPAASSINNNNGEDVKTSPKDGDIVPPPKRKLSPSSAKESPYSSSETLSAARARHSIRPPGLLKCSSCKATSSPEWRKGPSGKKELCNACGLRYARSRAKKEGTGGKRKRTEKAVKEPPRDSATPPSANSSTFSNTTPNDFLPQHMTTATNSKSIPSNAGFSIQYPTNSPTPPGNPYPPQQQQQPPASEYYSGTLPSTGGYYVSNDDYGSDRFRSSVYERSQYDRESREREREVYRERDRETREREDFGDRAHHYPPAILRREIMAGGNSSPSNAER